MLLLTRIESSRNLDFEPVSLQRFVEEQRELFSRRHPSRRIAFVDEDDLPPVNGQHELLAMVIDNLLSNADKYSPSETVITIALGKNDHGEAEITVRDEGIGVDDSELQNLFTAFYRGGAAKSMA